LDKPLQQGLRHVELFVSGRGIGLVDGLLSLVQRRFDPQPEGDDLGVQGLSVPVQIRLDGIRGMKIRNGAGSQQPKPPLGIFLSLS
jgi:hypothetical protein